MEADFQTIKQPEPNFVEKNKQNENAPKNYKIIKKPYVGEINLAPISQSPITDTLELKSKNISHVKYHEPIEKKKLFSIHSITSYTAIGCGIYALINLIRKK